ncbi:MAG: TonB-dependent receptor plug domain-containing protein [Bacteroidia bacterium]
MKYILAIALCLFLVPFANGQDYKLNCDSETLPQVFSKLEKEHGVYFSYSVNRIEEQKVTVTLKANDLGSLLDSLLHPIGLQAREIRKGFYLVETHKERQITVSILDAETSAPLAFANWQIGNKPFGRVANAKGQVYLTVEELNQDLHYVSYVGYETIGFLVDPNEIVESTIEVKLQKATKGLAEVVIIEYINRGISVLSDYTTTQIDIENLEILAGLPEKDILLSTQMIPGVASNDETASGINIRGGGKDQTLIYWDRIPVYHAAHYFGSISSFIPSSVNQIQVHRNYIPVYFNGATSGVLNIESFNKANGGFDGDVNLTSTHLDASVHLPIAKGLKLFAAGRNSYNHLISTPTFNSFSQKMFDGSKVGNIANNSEENDLDYLSSLLFKDLNSKLIWQPNRNNFLSISLLANSNNLNFSADNEEFERLDYQFHDVLSTGVNLFYKRSWSTKLSSDFSLTSTNYRMENRSKEVYQEEGEPEQDEFIKEITNSMENIEGKLGITYSFDSLHFLRIGYQYNQINSSLNYKDSSTFDDEYTDTLEAGGFLNGLYIDTRFGLGNRLEINPQFRLDYWVAGEEERAILPKPLVHLTYKVNSNLSLRSSLGIYSQYIRALDDPELDITNISENIWVAANGEAVDLLRSSQATLGFIYENKGFLFDADVFYKQLDGVIVSNKFTQDVEDEIEFADGMGTLYGLDIMLRKRSKYFSNWVSYSYNQSKVEFDEYSSGSIVDFLNRPHQLRIVSVATWKRLEGSIGWIFKSGTPFTEAVGVVQRLDEENEPYTAIEWGSINASRLENYHRLDASLWYDFSKEHAQWKGRVGFSVLNVYARENIWSRRYIIEENEVGNELTYELIEEEKFFLPFTPSFAFRVSF